MHAPYKIQDLRTEKSEVPNTRWFFVLLPINKTMLLEKAFYCIIYLQSIFFIFYFFYVMLAGETTKTFTNNFGFQFKIEKLK